MAFFTLARNTKTLVRKLVFFSFLARPSSSFISRQGLLSPVSLQPSISSAVRRMASSSTEAADITHINKPQMEEILEDYEEGGREESQYIVIDVRTEEEVYSTGKLSPNVHTLPVQVIMQANVFEMSDEEFEDFCGFAKPSMDETIVFSCAAGIRSVYACQFAAKAGYSKLVNYMGGSSEWFAPSQS